MEITLAQSALVPVIIGLVAAVKKVGMPSKWLPITAVLLGVIGVWLANGQETEWLAGIIVGLSSVGLYSGVKNTVK